MHLLATNVTNVHTIAESMFPKVIYSMNPHSESLYTIDLYAFKIVYSIYHLLYFICNYIPI